MLVGWCQSVFIRLELSKKNKYDPSPLKTLDQSRSLSKGHVQLGLGKKMVVAFVGAELRISRKAINK